MIVALWKRSVLGLAIAVLSLSLSRLVFFLNNIDAFPVEGWAILAAFVRGLRFDAVSTAFVLAPFVVLLPFHEKLKTFQRLYFLAAVGAVNLLNCIDAEFFRFISRRSTDDIFEFAFLSNDIFNIGFDLVRDFWYLILLWGVIMLIVLLAYNRAVHPSKKDGPDGYTNPMLWLHMLAVVAVLVVGMRGGFQRIPLGIIDAGQANDARLSVLELNSSFTILKTLGKPDLKMMEFYAEGENPISPIITPKGEGQGRLKGSNVVVLIVESLGSEYMARLNGKGKGYAPFVDSLCGEGLLFTNAFANGHRSIEGVPACMAALPTLMYEPFITSRYAQNHFSSLATLLGPEGYASYFLHGGENGTMGLQAFAQQAGFDHYIGKQEYPYEGHHDGHWGIFDHHFLSYATEVFSSAHKPFVAGIFTLSSHHPYTVPEELKGTFPAGELPIHESIGYGDHALRQFFEAAKKTDWYANTLFIITADHTSLSQYPEFQTKLGALSIPILFFHPGDTLLKGTSVITAQQIDIMPTALSLLGYDKPYFCFGQNLFDAEADHMAIAFKFEQYQMLHDGKMLSFDGQKTLGLHDVEGDPMLTTNVMAQMPEEVLQREQILKGYLQNYSQALIENRMTSDTWKHEEK
jgi:phosphoglycerol transferase MdoB-like AlkP superfamily enzyme